MPCARCSEIFHLWVIEHDKNISIEQLDKEWPARKAGLNVVLVSYLANTAMICYISGSPFPAMLAARAVQLAVMLPVQFLVLSWLHRSPSVRRLMLRAV